MASDDPSTGWLNRLRREGQPIYLALVDALETAIRKGELQPGDQLPPQRTVAAHLAIDFTTVTRAYGVARTRGLVEGAVGRGTFVRRRTADDEAGLADLSMNLPPPPQGVSLAALLKETTAAILDRTDVATLMAYHAGPGTLGQRAAGAAWLAPYVGEVALDRLVVCPGAQAALTALLTTITQQGASVVVEPLTYPGLLALGGQLGLRLLPCPVDDEGFIPESLERLCAAHSPSALYLIPTTQNPVASTMGLARRREIVAIADAADVWMIEDDPYSRLFDIPLPALVSLAPDRTFHIATLSKTLSPGLRTAFVVAPSGSMAERLTASLRATVLMGSPLTTAIATRWIRDGAAERLLSGVRQEARARRALAAEILPAAKGAAEGIHVWLDLPVGGGSDRLSALAAKRGLSLVAASAFAVEPVHRDGLRLSLGGPAKASHLRDALSQVAALLADTPTTRVVV